MYNDSARREIAVRTRDRDDTWVLTADHAGYDWTLTLISPDGTWTGEGTDCFEALRSLRSTLDHDGVLIGVNGARPNAWSSGMQRDMALGRQTYLCALGDTSRPPEVQTLDLAPLDEVGTVDDQDRFHAEWLTRRHEPG